MNASNNRPELDVLGEAVGDGDHRVLALAVHILVTGGGNVGLQRAATQSARERLQFDGVRVAGNLGGGDLLELLVAGSASEKSETGRTP